MAKKKRKKAVTKKRKKTKKSIKKRKKLKSRRHKKLSSVKKPKKNLKSKLNKRKKRGVKMSAEAMKVSSVLDTSHLKVKFPFKAKYGNYINGKFVEPKSGKYFDNVSPISNEKICSVARSNEQDVEAALDAAHAAFPEWGKTDITTRSNILYKIADVLEKNLNLLAVAECLDNGKPIRECMAADLPLVIDHWRYFAGVIRAEEGSIAEIANNQYSYNFHEPLGVVGQIVPWNFPLLMATWKLAPALAAGCTVIAKPASWTPLSLIAWLEAMQEAEVGLPENVVQVITGSGGLIGDALAGHPDIGGIVLTGGVPTGQAVMAKASEQLTPVTLELGGKGANVVFPDANLRYCAKAICFGIFMNAGQMCWAGSRLIVHEDIHDELVNAVVEEVGKWKIGPGMSEGVRIGSLVHTDHRADILRMLEEGLKQGGTVVTGGAAVEGEGAFMQPTIVTDVD